MASRVAIVKGNDGTQFQILNCRSDRGLELSFLFDVVFQGLGKNGKVPIMAFSSRGGPPTIQEP
jgi:hypothetical protein